MFIIKPLLSLPLQIFFGIYFVFFFLSLGSYNFFFVSFQNNSMIFLVMDVNALLVIS